jgi:ubiquinone/menaquinone biosynthesis C-methylase UbiE
MLRVLSAFLLFQVVIRVWLRVKPQPIPFGWSWLLENPWRQIYRNPQQTSALCNLKSTDTVLELGCGSGLFTRALATQCAHLITSDLQERYLEQTRLQTRGVKNIEYLCADALSIPLSDASVDVVLLISTLTEVAKPVDALLECKRVLKPGGRIVVSEEMFAPEYVPSPITDAWARTAGLARVEHSGNAWVYFCHYTPNS